MSDQGVRRGCVTQMRPWCSVTASMVIPEAVPGAQRRDLSSCVVAADPQIGKMLITTDQLVLRDQEIPLVAALPTE